MDEIFAWSGVCPVFNCRPTSASSCWNKSFRKIGRCCLRISFSPETREVVQTFRTVSAVLEQRSAEAIDTYITSGREEPANMLEVLLLAREARLFRPEEGISRLQFVPLLEARLEPLRLASPLFNACWFSRSTVGILNCAGTCKRSCSAIRIPARKPASCNRPGRSTKPHRDLGDLMRRTGVTIQIFHGRGGPSVAAAVPPTRPFWPSHAEPLTGEFAYGARRNDRRPL